MPPKNVPKSTAMVVDDTYHNRLLLQRLLEQNGHQAVCVASGTDALVQLGKTNIDLILLDVMIPMVNGFQLLQDIRKKRSPLDLPIIIDTAKKEGTLETTF